MTVSNSQVTLATIAAHLGVSRSTVSNAYNHPDQLSTQLRERILETAAKLGYNGPDPVARRLRKGRAGAIGVLFSEPLQSAFADPASVLFLEGIAGAGEDADSGLLLIPAHPNNEGASVVQNAMVDGFVLYSIPPGHPFVEAALRRRVPVVCVDQTQIGGTSWVGIDDRAAARESAQHLVDLGHRRIGVIVYGLGSEGSLTDDLPSPNYQGPCPSVSWLRMEGWGDALRSADLQWSDVSIEECKKNTIDAGADATRSLLALDDAPTAILCSSDELALGVLRAANELGIDVPSKLSIIGFNDTPDAAQQGLTTVNQPLRDKGSRAAQLLLDGEAKQHVNVNLDTKLIVRESTAKPGPH